MKLKRKEQNWGLGKEAIEKEGHWSIKKKTQEYVAEGRRRN